MTSQMIEQIKSENYKNLEKALEKCDLDKTSETYMVFTIYEPGHIEQLNFYFLKEQDALQFNITPEARNRLTKEAIEYNDKKALEGMNE